MEIMMYKKRKKFLDYFVPRKKAVIKCRERKILGLFSCRGYKTKIVSDEAIAECGDIKRFVDVFTRSARERGAKTPFSIPDNPPGNLGENYEVCVLFSDKREIRDSRLGEYYRRFRDGRR